MAMHELVKTALALDSSSARLAWLYQEHPTINRKLIDELLDEVKQVGSLDSQSVLKIAQLVLVAANLWMDDQTHASALRIEAEATRHDKPDVALSKYRDAVSIYEGLKLTPQAADATLGIVATLITLGEYPDGIAECEQLIDDFAFMDDFYGLGRAYINLGILNSMLGKFGSAMQNYEDARASFRQIDDVHWLAITDINEANVLEEFKQFNGAKEKYLRAQKYFIEIDATEMALKVEHNLAYLYFSLGEYQMALQLFTKVGQLFGDLGSKRNEAMADLYRSEVYIALNQWNRALAVVEKTRPFFEEAQMHREHGQALINQAISLANMQQTADALACCERARSIMPTESSNQVWHGLVDLYQSAIAIQAGQIEDASVMALRSTEQFGKLGIDYRLAQSQQLLGEIALEKSDLAEAENHFVSALKIAKSLNLSVLLYGCHHGLGQIYGQQREFSQASTHYQESIDALERLQGLIGAEDYKISYRSDKLDIYHEFIELCLVREDAPDIAKAFEIIERSRARTLLDSLTRAPAAKHLNESNSHNIDIQQLREELNWYYRQLFTPDEPANSVDEILELNQAIAERESVLAEMMKAEQHLDVIEPWNQNISVLNATEICKQLHNKTVILSYFVMDHSLLVFKLSKTEFQTFRLDVPKAFLIEQRRLFRFQLDRFQLSRSLGEAFIQSMTRSTNQQLSQLYDVLVRPILADIEKETPLVIVPYGPLHSVPFHALYDGSEYVIQNYPVSYAPSATFFCRITNQEKRANSDELMPPLIFGFNDELIDQAEIEADAIHQLYPEAEVFKGAEFESSRLLNNHNVRSFIHLATHGNLRTNHPKLSALKSADGWVTLYDIEQMPGTGKLITLSACNTGQNSIQSGDELLGFYKSFLATGASTLVLSLWPLHDETAVELMTAFYKELSQGKHVSCALRHAQLSILENSHQHPFYWAPFVAVGNADLML